MAGTIIMDFDDVLVNFAPKAFGLIRSNWRIFSRWFVDSGPLTEGEIYGRKAFSFVDFLLKKEFIQLSKKEYTILLLMINAEMSRHVFTDTFYDDLEPTRFAQKTLMNDMYINNSTIRKVYILSRNMTPGQGKSKERFIKRYFSNEKIEYIEIGPNQNKADAIKDRGIDWNLFVDDELKNIRNVVEAEGNLERKEILIPEYGYNKMDISLKMLINGKGGIYTYYDPFKNIEISAK